jgi:hypothetical protein
MTSLRLFPNAGKFRFLALLVAVLVGVPVAGYATLLAANAASAWRISRVLNSLEKIRVGDPPANLLRAIKGCTIQQKGTEYFCHVVHFQLQFPWLQTAISKVPESWIWEDRFRRLGLKSQYLSIFARVDSQQVQSISATLIVDGRYESLGQQWELAEHIPEPYVNDPSTTLEDRRTLMLWFHITSSRPGQGFHIDVTPASTPEELRARHANLHCLFSFQGCDGLCELMPDAIPVLRQRNRGFGGCTNAPASHCDLTYDEKCRKDFYE